VRRWIRGWKVQNVMAGPLKRNFCIPSSSNNFDVASKKFAGPYCLCGDGDLVRTAQRKTNNIISRVYRFYAINSQNCIIPSSPIALPVQLSHLQRHIVGSLLRIVDNSIKLN